MADAEGGIPEAAPAAIVVEDEEDEVFLDTTMFDEDDEWLEGALAAPDDEDEDPYYFVRARTTGQSVPMLRVSYTTCAKLFMQRHRKVSDFLGGT